MRRHVAVQRIVNRIQMLFLDEGRDLSEDDVERLRDETEDALDDIEAELDAEADSVPHGEEQGE